MASELLPRFIPKLSVFKQLYLSWAEWKQVKWPSGKSRVELQPGAASKGKPMSNEITEVTAFFPRCFSVQQTLKTGQKD